MSKLPDARKRAWVTRRKRYGKSGHNSPYSRPRLPCQDCERMADLIALLHVEGVLSEGQAAAAIGKGRIDLRKRADNYAEE